MRPPCCRPGALTRRAPPQQRNVEMVRFGIRIDANTPLRFRFRCRYRSRYRRVRQGSARRVPRQSMSGRVNVADGFLLGIGIAIGIGIDSDEGPSACPPIPEGFQSIRGREAHPGFTWETESNPEGVKHLQAPHLGRDTKVDISPRRPPATRNRPTQPWPTPWHQARRAVRR